MTGSTDSSKRIPRSLSTDTKLFGRFTMTDLLVGGLPGVIVILVTRIVVPDTVRVAGIALTTLSIPLALAASGVGCLFVYLTPRYLSSLDWLEQFVTFHQSESKLSHEAAKQHIELDELRPEEDTVLRNDGALVGAVSVDPSLMALATDAEWDQKVQAFQDFANTTVEFPIQIYSTTQPFPVDEYLETYEKRLNDPDVRNNPKLEALIESYVDWYHAELSQRRMTIRDHYVFVPVKPEEVQFERGGLAARFADLPLVGTAVQAITSPPVAEQQALMHAELDRRLREIERGLENIEDLGAMRVEAHELAAVMREFWVDRTVDADLSERIRTAPLRRRGFHGQ